METPKQQPRRTSSQDDPLWSTNAADAAAWPPENSRRQLAGVICSVFAVLLFVFLGVVAWQWQRGKKGAYAEREGEGEKGVELAEGKGRKMEGGKEAGEEGESRVSGEVGRDGGREGSEGIVTLRG